MSRIHVRSVLTIALILTACFTVVSGATGVGAASVPQSAPPTGLNAAHPTISGRLVAKPQSGEASSGTVICRERVRTPDVRALKINRGLVICTAEGELVLLQLSPSTRLFDRNWDTLPIGQLSLGDHINAWGVLQNGGIVLNPTFAVQDTTKPAVRLREVAGRLVAKPISSEGPTGPVICGNRDRTPDAQALMVNRGLVLCTAAGRLILLQLAPKARLLTRDRSLVTIAEMTIGDHLNAWGIFRAAGSVLDPTVTVVDTDTQSRATASQDFISAAGPIPTLFVLKSDAGGPVNGLVHAQQRDDSRVVLCGGAPGTWRDLRQGLTIDISQAIFNPRIATYVAADVIKLVNCP